MRITIASTEHDDRPTVAVSLPDDELTAYELADLFAQAMLAMGYHPDSVRDAMGRDAMGYEG